MKKMLTLFSLVCFVPFFSSSYAQGIYPNPSPHTILKQEVGNTNIEIRYDRPSARGREIFGKLVPYGKLWRTGAAYATTISFDKPVDISGNTVPAGKYTLLSIPGKDSWEIILNADNTLYGTNDYKKAKDTLRFTIKSKTTSHFQQSLTFSFDIIPNDAILSIAWENTLVSFEIKTNTNQDIITYMNTEIFTEKETNLDMYISGADFMKTYGMSLDSALVLGDMAVAKQENEYTRRIRMEIYEALGQTDNAKKEIEAALLYIKNHPTYSEKDKALSNKF
ncbi:MAG: hypothetical protein ACI8UX_001877 [Psychromonas sp.]|jgi:hypothetical protein